MNECCATVSIKPTALGHDKKSVSRGHARYPTEVMFTRSKYPAEDDVYEKPILDKLGL